MKNDGFDRRSAEGVTGDRRPYSGLPDARDRADLIAYMLQVFK
jgi:cytochrome c2